MSRTRRERAGGAWRCDGGRTAPARAFSLIELVVVIVILGVISAIAAPRMGTAVENARFKALRAATVELSTVIERYTVDHAGLTPAHAPDGTVDDDSQALMARLLGTTDERGNVLEDGWLGPYLAREPVNPLSECNWVRVNGQAAGAGCGWRFDAERGVLEPDQSGLGEHLLHPLYVD